MSMRQRYGNLGRESVMKRLVQPSCVPKPTVERIILIAQRRNIILGMVASKKSNINGCKGDNAEVKKKYPIDISQ
jgi:hypothetical protein